MFRSLKTRIKKKEKKKATLTVSKGKVHDGTTF